MGFSKESKSTIHDSRNLIVYYSFRAMNTSCFIVLFIAKLYHFKTTLGKMELKYFKVNSCKNISIK